MKIDHKKLSTVGGWLARTDLEICKALLLGQVDMACANDSVVEIGVHHGKSFVVFGAYSGVSKLYAVDVFESQESNIDHSGSGNKEIFLKNLDAFNIDRSRVVIDSRMSNEVKANDIVNAVGRVRFFHIDGGHHYEAVKNDLELAVNVLASEGVIAIDDVFRPEWPEVSMATFGTAILDSAEFVCFAVGFNKSYFCKRFVVDKYQNALRESKFLSFYLTKVYQPKNENVPLLIYQRYPLPEWRFIKIFSWALSIYKPELFVFFEPLSNRIKPNRIKRLIKRIIGR